MWYGRSCLARGSTPHYPPPQCHPPTGYLPQTPTQTAALSPLAKLTGSMCALCVCVSTELLATSMAQTQFIATVLLIANAPRQHCCSQAGSGRVVCLIATTQPHPHLVSTGHTGFRSSGGLYATFFNPFLRFLFLDLMRLGCWAPLSGAFGHGNGGHKHMNKGWML